MYVADWRDLLPQLVAPPTLCRGSDVLVDQLPLRRCIDPPELATAYSRLSRNVSHLCNINQVVQVDLNQPMSKIREILGGYSVRTRLSLTGTLVVARDIAHAKLQERIDAGKGLPDYVKDHIIYYAGEELFVSCFLGGLWSVWFGLIDSGKASFYVNETGLLKYAWYESYKSI